MAKPRQTKITVLLFSVILSGCASINKYDLVKEVEAVTKSTVTLFFLTPKEVEEKCESYLSEHRLKSNQVFKACSVLITTPESDTSVCEVVAPKPKNFADWKNLSLLGHEIWHCFGAKHVVDP